MPQTTDELLERLHGPLDLDTPGYEAINLRLLLDDERERVAELLKVHMDLGDFVVRIIHYLRAVPDVTVDRAGPWPKVVACRGRSSARCTAREWMSKG